MSQPNLNEDLNIVANSNIEITLLDGDLNIIQALDDEPNDVGGLTAAELKAKFDEAGNIIKTYINGTLIPEILAEDATEEARSAAEAQRETNEAQRIENENTRIAAEQSRASAETARDTAEQARVAAEQARADENTGIVARATEQANIASSAASSASNSASEALISEHNAEVWAEGGQLEGHNGNAVLQVMEVGAKGYAKQAKDSADAASISETAAKASENAAKASETAAKKSETTAKSEADRAKSEADRAAGIVGGDYATKTDLEKKQDKFVPITIPKGRMRGDVDGDGKITSNDESLINSYAVGNTTLDDIAKWCADTDANGYVNTTDAVNVNKYAAKNSGSSLTRTPTFADYYNNWTYEKIDDVNGQWYTDISLDGVSKSSSVLITIDPTYTEDIFINAVCGNGYVRIFAGKCPIIEVPCLAQISEGNVTGIIIPSAYRAHASRHSSDAIDPIDPASIGAAVDGDATNIDTHSVNGIFRISTACEGTFPSDISSKLGFLIHKTVSITAYREQIYMNRGTAKAYRRTYSGSAGWGDWKEIYDSGNKPTPSDIGAASPAKVVTVTLAAASWDSTAKTQTVTVTGVSATETDQMITPTPALASQTAYYEASILCTGQAADSLTFTCNTVPTADLTVYVVIQEVAQG